MKKNELLLGISTVLNNFVGLILLDKDEITKKIKEILDKYDEREK